MLDAEYPARKVSPKAGTSPRKKNSLSSLLPRVAHAIGGAYDDYDVEHESIYPPVAPLQIGEQNCSINLHIGNCFIKTWICEKSSRRVLWCLDLKTPSSSKKKGKRAMTEMYESDDEVDVTEDQVGIWLLSRSLMLFDTSWLLRYKWRVLLV